MKTGKQRAIALLLAVVAVTAGVAFYFFSANPILDHINKGLDLEGGIHVVYEAIATDDRPVTVDSIKAAVHTIRRRVDALGVVEPRIYPEGDRRIIVELPGVDDPEMALEVIGRTAFLEFLSPTGEEVIVTGANLRRAYPDAVETVPGRPAEAVVQLEFDTEGARMVGEAMSLYVGQSIIIRLDGETIMTPVVRDAPSAAVASPFITGYDTLADAEAVAIMLNSGALPIELRVLRTQYVSATLGEESVAQSFQAALLGATAVVAFMILLYRIPGFWATIALAIYLLLVLGILAGINATLTLPGIAGLILSIGMAVDANVVIFERIREELRVGKTLRAAIRGGFQHAFRAILDANVTTLIAAVVLYWMATGPIRGFAVTLSVGIVASMITAMVVTRQLLILSVDSGLVRDPYRTFRVRKEASS